MDEKKTITLSQLALRLNMHVSTISRVLNGSEEEALKAASKPTIERIRTLARQYNYKRNPHAISLRTNKSMLIGVLVPRLSDYVWATIYEGIEGAALHCNYFAYVTNSYDKLDWRQKQVGIAESRLVDGLILGDTHTTEESINFLQSLSLPFVLVLREAGDFLSVTCDDYEGGRQAAQHLFERGHREVAVVAGAEFTSTGRNRTAGFVDYYKEGGYQIAPERIVTGEFDTKGGRDSAELLLRKHPSLTAIYAVNDFAAIGAMGAMRAANLVPGVSMALIGYNDTPLAAELPIPLTSVRTPLREIGLKTMNLLIDKLQGKQCESILLKPRLVIRESSSYSARSLL